MLKLAVVAALILVATDPTRTALNHRDLAFLQGKWQLIPRDERERKELDERWRVQITGNRVRHLKPDGSILVEDELDLDASKTPKELNLYYLDNGKRGSLAAKCIYKLAEDEFVICVGEKDRPKEFVTKLPVQSVTVLKRVR